MERAAGHGGLPRRTPCAHDILGPFTPTTLVLCCGGWTFRRFPVSCSMPPAIPLSPNVPEALDNSSDASRNVLVVRLGGFARIAGNRARVDHVGSLAFPTCSTTRSLPRSQPGKNRYLACHISHKGTTRATIFLTLHADLNVLATQYRLAFKTLGDVTESWYVRFRVRTAPDWDGRFTVCPFSLFDSSVHVTQETMTFPLSSC